MVFTFIGEAWGFVGSATVVFLYFYLFYQVLVAGLRSNSRFCMYICVALIFSLVFQTVENIGAVIGLLPLKGIPLPFLSQGGTSLVMAITSLGFVKEEKPLPENTNKNQTGTRLPTSSSLGFTIEIVFGIQPKVVEVVDSCNVLLNNKTAMFRLGSSW